MNPFRLVIKELFYRKVSSIIILLTVIAASTVSVAVYTLSKASENETRKIMREQGLNLYIFPKGTETVFASATIFRNFRRHSSNRAVAAHSPAITAPTSWSKTARDSSPPGRSWKKCGTAFATMVFGLSNSAIPFLA